MKIVKKTTLSLALLLLLPACNGKSTSAQEELPQSYFLGGNQVSSINSLVDLNQDVEFEQTSSEQDATLTTYRYSNLSNGGEIAKAYTQALEQDWECTIQKETDSGEPIDYNDASGEVLVTHALDNLNMELIVDIQWDETTCSVTLSQKEMEEESITVEEAISHLQSLSPSFLRLPGASMDEYIVHWQEGTVYLNDQPCLCLNVYQAQSHQIAESYLLSVPDMKVYLLDRSAGDAVLLE